MEWYDKINEFVNGLPEWRWTYSRPGSWGGNYWLGLLGEKTYRFWLGIIVAVALAVSIMLCCMTGEGSK